MDSPAKPLNSLCPRCRGAFHCGAHSPGPCQCDGLQLTPALRQQLNERYTGCLCRACLQALAAEAAGGAQLST